MPFRSIMRRLTIFGVFWKLHRVWRTNSILVAPHRFRAMPSTLFCCYFSIMRSISSTFALCRRSSSPNFENSSRRFAGIFSVCFLSVFHSRDHRLRTMLQQHSGYVELLDSERSRR